MTFPSAPSRCSPRRQSTVIEWARDLFGKLFSQAPKSALKILEEGEDASLENAQDLGGFKEGVKLLKERPKTFEDCVAFARKAFEYYFNHVVRQLLHVDPLDAKTKEGAPFWTLPMRAPAPLVFDETNLLHLKFISSTSCLQATVSRSQYRQRSQGLTSSVSSSAKWPRPSRWKNSYQTRKLPKRFKPQSTRLPPRAKKVQMKRVRKQKKRSRSSSKTVLSTTLSSWQLSSWSSTRPSRSLARARLSQTP